MMIGRMRHRILIRTRSDAARTATGAVDSVWSTAATRWGDIQPLTGKEYTSGEHVQGEVTHKIVLRYYDGLKDKDRLKFGSRIFEIISIVNSRETKRVHIVMAKELID